ncbi:MAG: DUF6728 family protein [Chitinophagaceae bacterium]
MGFFSQIAEYLYLKKKDPNAPNSSFLRSMHSINKISLFMFIAAILFIIIKKIFFHK